MARAGLKPGFRNFFQVSYTGAEAQALGPSSHGFARCIGRRGWDTASGRCPCGIPGSRLAGLSQHQSPSVCFTTTPSLTCIYTKPRLSVRLTQAVAGCLRTYTVPSLKHPRWKIRARAVSCCSRCVRWEWRTGSLTREAAVPGCQTPAADASLAGVASCACGLTCCSFAAVGHG